MGDSVLFSMTGGKTWQPGTVLELGQPGDPVFGDKYLVNSAVMGRGWYDRHYVVRMDRERFWTAFFLGDWEISVPMSVNYRTEGRDLYMVVGGGVRLPPLRISADGTYAWRVGADGGERVINGVGRRIPMARV